MTGFIEPSIGFVNVIFISKVGLGKENEQKKIVIKIISLFGASLFYLVFFDFSYPVIYIGNNFDFQKVDFFINDLLNARNDFVNVILFVFLVIFLDYLCWKRIYSGTKKIQIGLVLMGFIKDVLSIFLAIALILFWSDLYAYIWQWEYYRVTRLTMPVLTIGIHYISSFILLTYDPITPVIYNMLSEKTIGRFLKSKLASIGIVSIALSTRLVFHIDEYLPSLIVWIGINVYAWVNYFRLNKKNYVQVSVE